MAIQLLPNARSRYSDGTGKPLSQGTVGVYVAGTSFGTLATIWDTVTKDSELTNPFTLDDAGEAEIWYDVEVDVQIKDSTGTVVDTPLGLNPNVSEPSATGFNLAQNGSFEVDSNNDGQPDSWTIGAYTGSAIAITNSIVTDGIAALEFNTGGAGTGGGTATSVKFPVTEGSVISLAFSFRQTHGTGSDGVTTNTFSINWYDETDSLQSTSTVTMPASGSAPLVWTNYQEEITVDAAGTQGEIVLTGISSGGSNLSEKAYFDGISIINNAGIVTLTGTQTLTNKTLTSPTTTTPTVNGFPSYGLVILDTPDELVSTASADAGGTGDWNTLDMSAVFPQAHTDGAVIAKLKIKLTAQTTTATSTRGAAYVRKKGLSGAVSDNWKVAKAFMQMVDASGNPLDEHITSFEVSLDANSDFEYQLYDTVSATTLSLKIYLVGYYV